MQRTYSGLPDNTLREAEAERIDYIIERDVHRLCEDLECAHRSLPLERYLDIYIEIIGNECMLPLIMVPGRRKVDHALQVERWR